MLIRIGFEIEVICQAPVPMLLALSVHPKAQVLRVLGEDRVRVHPDVPTSVYHDRFNNRITRIEAPAGPTRFWSDCVVEVSGRPDPQAPEARQQRIPDLPDGVVQYLLPSRYCDSDLLVEAAWQRFGGLPEGWARVSAITQFVHQHVTFGYAFGRPSKTAFDVFREQTGVCRDFAHLSIALCRAMNIPARYASGYLGDIGVPYSGPGDFCAWFEVWLDGRWHTFDARYDTPRIGRVLMVRGMDAADVAMLTSFGSHQLTLFRVWCNELSAITDEAEVQRLLADRPAAEARIGPHAA